jgi:hypothetical protein
MTSVNSKHLRIVTNNLSKKLKSIGIKFLYKTSLLEDKRDKLVFCKSQDIVII